jgi:hypothetical protein
MVNQSRTMSPNNAAAKAIIGVPAQTRDENVVSDRTQIWFKPSLTEDSIRRPRKL